MSTPRRDLILDEARRQFVEKGYSGTAVGDIASSLDLSKAAITYYFPKKQHFLDALLEPLLTDLEQIAEQSTDGLGWPQAPRRVFSEFLARLVEDQDLARWVNTDRALLSPSVYGARLAHLSEQLIGVLTNSTEVTTAQRARALAAIGGIWRPVLELDRAAITEHLDIIVNAALVSFAPVT